jgi:hypothetical protein
MGDNMTRPHAAAVASSIDNETKLAAQRIMHVVFHLMFDSVSESEEAVVRMVDVPSYSVSEYVCGVLSLVGIRGRTMYINGTIKLDVHVGCIITTQTKIMQYYAHQVNKLPRKSPVTFRLPGSEWRAPAGKLEADMTPRQLMFAKTYAALIPADRLERVLDEAEDFNYDKLALSE